MSIFFKWLNKRETPPKKSKHTISLPSSLNSFSCLSFSTELHSCPHVDHYIFDFSQLRNFEPFAMLVVSNAISEFRNSKPSSTFEAAGYESCGYAGHMGFFKSFGIQYGNAPGQARGSRTHLPVNYMDVAEIKQLAHSKCVAYGQIVEDQAHKHTTVLTQTDKGELHNLLKFCMTEIIRNIIEHSSSGRFGLCAQYWPSTGYAEFAAIDAGIGLKNSLSKNPKLTIPDDREALKTSILPGVTGNYKDLNSDDVWSNKGFGLYMTSRICLEGGEFLIASGQSALRLRSVKRTYPQCQLTGTGVRLYINTRLQIPLKELLGRYSSEGTQIAKDHGYGSSIESKNASMMLDRYKALVKSGS